MFTREEVKRKLLGCFEILLFMPAGVQRFEGGREQAMKSFIIPVVMLPFLLIVLVALSPEYAWALTVFVHFVRIVVTLAAVLGVVYLLAKQFKKEEYFYKFLNVSNWCNVPSVLFTVPILYAFLMGHDIEALESYAVFVTLIGVFYSAFVMTHSFKVPWELGGFMAVAVLAIDQNIFIFANYVRDIMSL